MKNITLGFAALLLGATVACSSGSPVSPTDAAVAATAERAAAPQGRAALPTIAGIAQGNPAFTTLVAALAKAGLVSMFDGSQHFTVFAPTNDAFDAAAVSLGFSDGPALVAALSVEQLTAILQYHVTRGDRNAQSVLSAGSLIMLDGNRTSVSVVNGTPRINEAPIAATDIRARNGIVHVIGAVLLPPQ